MKKSFKSSLFVSLFPWAFFCFQYNQCHGYFAESYEVLFSFIAGIYLINMLLLLVKLPANFIFASWFVFILPNLANNLYIDILFKFFIALIIVLALKKAPLQLIKVLLTIVLGFNLFQIIQKDFSARKKAKELIKNIPINKNFSCDKNIYWIVCDAYTSVDVLKQYYHFDNGAFYQQLQNLGFLTPDGQLPYTEVNEFPTLKALNFYTNFNRFDVTKENAFTLHYCLKYNVLFNNLKQNGYTFLATSTRSPFLHKLNEVKILGETYSFTCFQFLYHCCKQNTFLGQLISSYLNKTLYLQQEDVFQNFTKKFITSGKNFYYLHIESPHAPFVRKKNNTYCNDQKSIVWGENEVGKNAYVFEDYQDGYINQLQGLNKKVLELLKSIEQKDPNGIVILQGDHGTFVTEDLKEQQALMFATKNAPFENIKSEQIFKQFIYGE